MGNAMKLELHVTRPSGAAVVRDYMEGRPGAVDFYGAHFSDLEAYRSKASEVDARFDREARRRAAAAIRIPEGADPVRLDRFVEEGGYLVTTGQQPALAGGPLYSVYKALTAVALAHALEAALERPVLPLFWVASEDHDWAEANHACLIGTDNELHCVALPAPHGEGVHPPLHRIPMGSGIEACIEAFTSHLPDSEFSGPYVELLRTTATPDATLPSAFSALMEGLLGRFGLFFTDAADPTLKTASLPVLLTELDSAERHERVLDRTGSALEAAGYDLQVHLLEAGVNLFLEGAAGRERLYRDEAGFRLHNSGERVTRDEVVRRAEADPSVLSPNVLLRPVVESAVFPTLTYVGGPGEIAYFAELGAYFEAFGIRMPVIHPRFSVTAVEGKVRKVLDKFDLSVDALRRPFHEVAGEIARDEVPEDIRRAVAELRGAIARGVGDLQKKTRRIDPTLKGPVQHVRSHAFDALDDLERNIVHAVKRENEITLSQLEKARHHLFPMGKPQERIMNVFYYLSRYGGAFLDEVFRRFRMNPDLTADVS